MIATWHMLTHGTVYEDPGGDYYTRRDPAKARDRAVGQLRSMGYRVVLEPLPQTG